MSKRRKEKARAPELSVAKKRIFKLVALLAPLIFLLVSELALRLTGYEYETSFFKRVQINGVDCWTGNTDFGRRFFPKSLVRAPGTFAFPIQKPAGTKRIFVLGESAALGDPQSLFGFSRMLDRLLHERFPSNQFEVVNVAMTAINSHVILPIARDCATKEGDLWIIYMGNNEVVGPYGAGTVFSSQTPPLPAIRASLWFKTTRIGQLCDEVAQRWRGNKDREYWKGMELMAQQQVPSSDPRMPRLYANFEKNLRDTLAAARSPVILSTVAVNKKDCPPFASKLAETEFLAGNLQRAVDEDALRFRADSAINEIIRRAEERVRFVDADRIFGDAGSEDFYEHVHFTPTGNYKLARMFADQTVQALGLQSLKTNWISQTECEQLIGLTDWNRSRGCRLIIDRMKQPPFIGTLDHTNRLARLEAEEGRLRANPDYKNAAATVLKSAALFPNDWALHYNAGVLLSLASDYGRATDELKTAIRLMPVAPDPYFSLAGMLAFQGKHEEAIALYKDCLRFGENFDVLVRLGFVEFDAKRYEDAIAHLRAAIQSKPDSIGARLRLGAALLQTGKPQDAQEQFRQVLRLEPNHPDAQQLLKRAGG